MVAGKVKLALGLGALVLLLGSGAYSYVRGAFAGSKEDDGSDEAPAETGGGGSAYVEVIGPGPSPPPGTQDGDPSASGGWWSISPAPSGSGTPGLAGGAADGNRLDETTPPVQGPPRPSTVPDAAGNPQPAPPAPDAAQAPPIQAPQGPPAPSRPLNLAQLAALSRLKQDAGGRDGGGRDTQRILVPATLPDLSPGTLRTYPEGDPDPPIRTPSQLVRRPGYSPHRSTRSPAGEGPGGRRNVVPTTLDTGQTFTQRITPGSTGGNFVVNPTPQPVAALRPGETAGQRRNRIVQAIRDGRRPADVVRPGGRGSQLGNRRDNVGGRGRDGDERGRTVIQSGDLDAIRALANERLARDLDRTPNLTTGRGPRRPSGPQGSAQSDRAQRLERERERARQVFDARSIRRF